MKKVTIIPLHIYPFEVAVAFNLPYNELSKELQKILPKELHDEIDGLDGRYDARTYFFEQGGQTVINFHEVSDSLIAHEAFHAACFILNHIGMQLTRESEEAYAYLIGYLVDEIHKAKKKIK